MEIIGILVVIVAAVVMDGLWQRVRRHATAAPPPPVPVKQTADRRTAAPRPRPLPRREPPAPLAEEGVRVTVDDVPGVSADMSETNDEPDAIIAEADATDWRGAIIYNEILKTKF